MNQQLEFYQPMDYYPTYHARTGLLTAALQEIFPLANDPRYAAVWFEPSGQWHGLYLDVLGDGTAIDVAAESRDDVIAALQRHWADHRPELEIRFRAAIAANRAFLAQSETGW